MPKRKRGEDGGSSLGSQSDADSLSDVGETSASHTTIDIRKLSSKLHHHLRILRATAKRARTFETQRIVKRLKSRGPLNDEERQELEAELAVLKNIVPRTISAQALLTKCAKQRLLPPKGRPTPPLAAIAMEETSAEGSEFPLLLALQTKGDLPAIYESMRQDAAMKSQSTRSKAEEKVHARLTSSKILAEETGKVVQELQRIIHPDKAAAAKKGGGQSEKGGASADRAEEKKKKKDKDGSTRDLSKKATLTTASEEAKIHKATSPDDTDVDNEDTAHASDEMESDLGEVDTSDSDDEGDEDINSDIYNDEEGAASDDEPDSEDEDEMGAKSHNLPALAGGFVPRGLPFRDRGSDSDYSGGSDDEDDDADQDEIDENAEENAAVGADGKKKSAKKEAKRKNRMGQRARQAIWEKKYGRNARHIAILKREPRSEAKDGHGAGVRGRGRGSGLAGRGRGGRAGPTSHTSPGGLQRDRGWASAREGQALGPQPRSAAPSGRFPSRGTGHVTSAPPRPSHGMSANRTSDGVLPKAAATAASVSATTTAPHPSWVAKQKQKEQMSQALSVKPAGKKVVFD